MGDGDGVTAALGQRGLGGVVGGVKVDIWHLANQTIRPVISAKARLFAGHEFQGAMHAEMQQSIGFKGVAQPQVELREGMGGGKAALEQQAHRVAFIAERGLQSDKDIAELFAQHEHPAAIGLHATGGGAPDGFHLGQMGGVAHDDIGIDKGRDIGGLAVKRGIAPQNSCAQVIDRYRHIKGVAIGLHRGQRVVQAFKHRQVSCGASSARIRRKAEQHDAQLFVGIFGLMQLGQPIGFLGQRGDTLGAGGHRAAVFVAFAHVVATLAAIEAMTTRKNGGVCCAVNFRQRDQHGGFNRAKALACLRPLAEGLKLQGVRGDIGHIQRRQGGHGGGAVVVGGAPDKAETGQRHHRVNAFEIGVDRGAAIKPTRKGRDAGDALGLKRGDHRIIMRGIRRQHIRPQHQKADGGGGPRRTRYAGQIAGDAARKLRVIKPDIGVIDRGF